METFKDAEGRVWKIDLRFSHILAFEDEVGVKAEELLEKPIDSPKEFAQLIWICVRKQAEERKIPFDDFIDSLYGEEIAQAQIALLLEIARFFSRRTKDNEQVIEQIKKELSKKVEQALMLKESPLTAEELSSLRQEQDSTLPHSSTAPSPSGSLSPTQASGSEVSGTIPLP